MKTEKDGDKGENESERAQKRERKRERKREVVILGEKKGRGGFVSL